MKYIKRGIVTLIPLLLVVQVFIFLGNFSKDLFETLSGQELEWWMVGAGVAGILVLTFVLGFILTHLKFVKRWKDSGLNAYHLLERYIALVQTWSIHLRMM